MFLLLLCVGSCACAAGLNSPSASPVYHDSSPKQLSPGTDSERSQKQHSQESNIGNLQDVQSNLLTSTRFTGATRARLETLELDDEVEVLPQQPQDPQYPQHPQYPQYPQHPQFPQHPQYPQRPQYPHQPHYPQHPQYPHYPRYPWQHGAPAAPGVVFTLPGGGVYVLEQSRAPLRGSTPSPALHSSDLTSI
ncbi:IgA FC receptor [Eumeta japonica]|uniref:IgA FC receptor n=1 Tax=Eumeta variegata TaxID=151549 RepID=A0A4C1XDZ8_EUMVA|nr:IgA FC receptor [Eumeta japonica]